MSPVLLLHKMGKIDDDLKIAIVQMPQKEKDKLLLRLVAKDKKLVERLIFELVEKGTTTDSRAVDIRRNINHQLPYSDTYNNTPGWLMMDLRSLNGVITAHVQATKDKPGEVILGAYLFAEAVRRNADMLHKMQRRADKLAPYMAKRAADLLKKAAKIHEDYYLEFRQDITELLEFLHNYAPAKAYLGDLPKTLHTR